MKRLPKKVTHIFAALILTFTLFMGPLLRPVKAATAYTGHGTFTQGSYDWVYAGAGSEWLQLGVSGMQIHIEMTQVYNGVLTVTISGISNFADYGYFVVGAQINTTSLNQIQLQLYQSQDIDIYIYSSKSYVANTQWTVSVSGSNMNGLGTELSSLRTISTAITSTVNGLPAIHNDLESVEQAISVLSGYVDDIESTLNNMLYIDRFINVHPWQYTAVTWPWYNNGSNMVSYGFERGLIYYDYNSSGNHNAYYDPACIKIPAGKHLGFFILSNISLNSSNVKIYASNNNTDLSGMIVSNNFYQSGAPYYKTLIHLENKSNNFIYLSLEFTQNVRIYPIYLGDINNIPDEVCNIFGINYSNTYTSLLNQINSSIGSVAGYVDQLEGYVDGVESLLQSINSGVQAIGANPTVIQQTNTTINNYTTAYTEVNNIENNVMLNFDTEYNGVVDIINQSGILYENESWLQRGVTFFDYSFSLVQGIRIFKYPIYVILVLFVLGCFLG